VSAKHTPGPWDMIEHSWECTSIGNGKVLVAELHIDSDCAEETQGEFEEVMDANARLIASAPELLGALKIALIDMKESNRIHPDAATRKAIGIAEAAIEKAEKGESK
jgi:hypothetical protein